MATPRPENPQLDLYYILDFDESNELFPIVAVHKDATLAPYPNSVPAPWSQCPFADQNGIKYPKNIYVGETRYSGNQRAIWKFMILPGPFIQTDKVDEESGIVQPTYKRKNIPQNINPGEYLPGLWAATTAFTEGKTIIGGTGVFVCITPGTTNGTQPVWPTSFGATVTDGSITWMYVCSAGPAWQASHAYVAPNQVIGGAYLFEAQGTGTSGSSAPAWPSSGTVSDGGVTWLNVGQAATVTVERDDIDSYIAWEIIKGFPTTTLNSLATALVSQREMSFPFPARLDVLLTQQTENADIGYIQPRSTRVSATIKTYWVSGKVATIAYDVISPEPTIGVSVGNPGTSAGVVGIATYRSVLIDATNQWYSTAEGFILIKFNASQPSFSTYQGITYNLATLSSTNGTDVITGSGTHFLTDQFAVGQSWGNTSIQSIDSDTHMTLVANYTGTTITDQPFFDRVNGAGWVDTVREPIAPSITPELGGVRSKIERVFMVMQ